jgi:hypothetical protein
MVAWNGFWLPWTWDFRTPLDRSAKSGPTSLRSGSEQAQGSAEVGLGDQFHVERPRLALEGV